MHGLRLVLAIAVLCLSLPVFPALAEEAAQGEAQRAEAKRLLREGNALMKEGEFATALGRYEQAYSLVKSPVVLFNVGLAQRRLGRLVDSHRTFSRVLYEATPQTPPRIIEDTRAHLRDLDLLVARLQVRANQADAVVEVDDQEVGKAPLQTGMVVTPGLHRVRVSKQGFAPWVGEVQAIAGKEQEVGVTLVALSTLVPTPPATPAQPPAAAATTRPPVTTAPARPPVTAAPARPATAAASPPVGRAPVTVPAAALTTTASRAPATPAPAPGRTRQPIYKRWWFWTALGVAVAGGAAGTAVALTQKGSLAPAPITSFGDYSYPK